MLVAPEIHWNAGNAGRSCLAAGAQLHLVRPLGFSLGERALKRAGLHYWQHVKPIVWQSWAAFETELPRLGEPLFFTAGAGRPIWDVAFPERAVCIFGRESQGLGSEVLARYPGRGVAIPLRAFEGISLNLSTAVGIALYEARRQRSSVSAP